MNLLNLRQQYGLELTSQQQEHVEGIISRMAEKIYKKYAAGQRKHGGNVWERDSLKDLDDEVTDIVVYNDLIQNGYGSSMVADE